MKRLSDRLKILILISVVVLAGCVATRAGAYRVFAEDLERLEGKPIAEAYIFNIGYLAKEQPTSIKTLANGNEIRIYKVQEPRKEKCTVLIEVDAEKKLVIEASSKGNECLRSY